MYENVKKNETRKDKWDSSINIYKEDMFATGLVFLEMASLEEVKDLNKL